MRRRWIAVSIGIAGTAAASVTGAALTALAQGQRPASPALAQGQRPATPAPVLHQDLRPPARAAARPRRLAPDAPAVLGRDPAAGRNPTAIRDDGKILPEPEASPAPASGEPIHGRGGFGADRRTESVPDDRTGGDDTLRYIEVFNPSVVPFKRMSALDAVRGDYTFGISDSSETELRVTGSPTPGFDRFWGSLLVDLRPGESVPIPSVAPEMRIISYEVEPHTQLIFSADGADNFYVRSEEPNARGVHRLVFLVEASPRYFAPQVPRGLRVSDIPARRLHPLPDRVQRVAQEAQNLLKLRRDMSLEDALARLVAHFRAFEPKQIRNPTGDIYWDLLSQQAGVCRHRAFAFMITANALGIPTRFVSNEAHAWVEIWLPHARASRDGSWMRVDLGGAAVALEVKNASGKSMYRPRGEDPFPKPPEYSQNYTRLEGDISGLSDDQIAEAQTPRAGRPGPSGGPGGGGRPARAAAAEGEDSGDDSGESTAGDAADFADGDDDADEPLLPGPGDGLPAVADSQRHDKRPTAIRVIGAAPTAFRGETVAIEGVVIGAGDAGLADQTVVLYLAPAGRGGDGARIVGHTVSGPDGRFRAEVVVPYETELMAHEVFASTPGDDQHQPAVSR